MNVVALALLPASALRLLAESQDVRERVKNHWPLIDPVTFQEVLNVKVLTWAGWQTLFTVDFYEAAEYIHNHD